MLFKHAEKTYDLTHAFSYTGIPLHFESFGLFAVNSCVWALWMGPFAYTRYDLLSRLFSRKIVQKSHRAYQKCLRCTPQHVIYRLSDGRTWLFSYVANLTMIIKFFTKVKLCRLCLKFCKFLRIFGRIYAKILHLRKLGNLSVGYAKEFPVKIQFPVELLQRWKGVKFFRLGNNEFTYGISPIVKVIGIAGTFPLQLLRSGLTRLRKKI